MIIFQNVSKRYTKEVGSTSSLALDNLSFQVKKGEVLGLIGPNGAGKSTSIKLLMNFIRPDTGNISIFSSPPNLANVRKKIGYLPEVANFPANLSVYDLLKFTGKTCAIDTKQVSEQGEKLFRLLDLWGVHKKPLRTYSKGMQQRANFVIALINDPELLILDEPMSGLDPMGRKKIIDLIVSLKHEGKTILFCSHILEDVDRLVDNVLILNKGKKLFMGSPQSLEEQENSTNMTEAFVKRVKKENLNE